MPSQGNCLPVVFAGTASPPFGAELAAGAGSGAGVVAGAAGRGIMGKSPGCGINSSCCGGAKVPGLPRPGMSAVGFTIPACKGGGGGTGGGIPGTIPGIDIALALKARRHAYLILQCLNPSAQRWCFFKPGRERALRRNEQINKSSPNFHCHVFLLLSYLHSPGQGWARDLQSMRKRLGKPTLAVTFWSRVTTYYTFGFNVNLFWQGIPLFQLHILNANATQKQKYKPRNARGCNPHRSILLLC